MTPTRGRHVASGCLVAALAAWVAITWAVHAGRLPWLRGWWPGGAGFFGPGNPAPP